MIKNDKLPDYINFFKTAYCFTDSQRNHAYESWISENVKDKTVIDLGAGSGILCYLAVKYGAKKVYALERRGELIDRMKEILGDSVEYIHGDLLETELPECDIYLHEWLSSELWNERRYLKNFYEAGDKELEAGHILDLVEYAKRNNFIDKLYPNRVELSDIRGGSESVLVEMRNEGKNIEQEQSYVAGNNVFCVYNADSEDVVKEHAERAGVPVNEITLVSSVLKHNTNK